MKTVLVAVVLVFAVALAIVVGNRLPVDAVTVIVGVVCGVLASIPTSLLILAVTGRRETRYEPLSQQTYPPVVVVNAPPGTANNGQMWPSHAMSWPAPQPPSGPREFRIIGQDSNAGGNGPYVE